jgi:hypothetical protein
MKSEWLLVLGPVTVPLSAYLQGQEVVFEPETLKAMTAAYVEACRSLGLTDRDDPLTRLVAQRIIDAAIEGERDPKRLRMHGIYNSHRAG